MPRDFIDVYLKEMEKQQIELPEDQKQSTSFHGNIN
jgi:hypothetical protein